MVIKMLTKLRRMDEHSENFNKDTVEEGVQDGRDTGGCWTLPLP